MEAKKQTVLVVDDEVRIRRLLAEFLVRAGYDVAEAADGESALEIIYGERQRISLVVLDVMMPRVDGWDVLEKIRECYRTPVIMLTARSEESDQLRGFRLGADDYVTKPFSPSVVVARIDKLLHRDDAHATDLVSGRIAVSDYAREVTLDGVRVDVTPKEYELLRYFILNRGMALSREKILGAVWNYDYLGDLRTVDTHVKQLRAKLGAEGERIVTVRNVGYKLI